MLYLPSFDDLAFPENGVCVMKQLKRLELQSDLDSVDDFEFDAFLANKQLKGEHVTHLKCINVDLCGIPPLMVKLQNVQYLGLKDAKKGCDANKMVDACSGIKGLSWINNKTFVPSNEQQLVSALGPKLEFLSLYENEVFQHDLSSIDFKNLQEFGTRHCSTNSIDSVLKSAVNLKKVRIESVGMPAESMEKTIIKLLASCHRLEYLEFSCMFNEENGLLIESVLNGIESGLFEVKRRMLRRKKLKMCIVARYNTEDAPDQMLQKFDRIFMLLLSSDIADFMFILDFDDIALSVDQWKETLTSDVDIMFRDKLFLISNKNCKINGWRESWIMEL